jgi:lipopolysaccharide transport system ATP-binding protein
VVGIIGKNGAGKSTLLKLLSKVTAPTIGTIRARGRIASLLEVGTGFHGEMTGRENIYMNGAILGMTKAEIDRKMDEIIDFSGCEKYIDTPVKRYSSGMTVRLGFAVAAFLDPEILVVDEVLAVGDAEFQKKAIGKMKDVSQGQGRTVLFVSHNMASVRQLCKSGVLLENGTIKMTGNIDEVVTKYQAIDTGCISLADNTNRIGSGKMRLVGIKVLNTMLEPIDTVMIGDTFFVDLILQNNNWSQSDSVSEFSFALNDEYGQRNIVMNNIYINKNIGFKSNQKMTIVRIKVDKCQLNSGLYSMAFYMSDNFEVVDALDSIGTILVEPGDFYGTGKIHRQGLGKFVWNYDMEVL